MNSVDKYINKIHNSDCIELLNQLPNKSIDCIVIDPPYMNVVNEKWDRQWKTIDDYVSAKFSLFEKEGLENAVINIGDSYGTSLVEKLSTNINSKLLFLQILRDHQ